MNQPPTIPGQAARSLALAILARVLDRRRTFEDVIEESALAAPLGATDERERRYAFALARTTLRHLGQVDDLLARWVDKPLPARAGPTPHILRIGVADILFLKTEGYAAVNSAVDLATADPKARHFRGLVNAVLRRAATEGADLLAQQNIAVLLPPWLTEGWQRAYGPALAEEIIRAHTAEPPLDLTLKPDLDTAEWAAKLDAQILPTGTLRRARGGSVQSLPGFADGAWWVQDAAAALPVRLFQAVRGQTIIDLCAAPGGKTAALAAAGANVIAVDRSEDRMARLRGNLERLKLTAQTAIGDARDYRPAAPADGVLLDAPCSATGTIRRHPDLPWIKEADDIRALALFQTELIAAAFAMLTPGGTLIYSVCSLEPEEGPELIAKFLAREPGARRAPIDPAEIPGAAGFITVEGDLRTLPCHWIDHGGIDGFYAARILRTTAN